MRGRAALVALLLLALGTGAAWAVTAATTDTVSVCAPGATVAVNGTPVATTPGACATTTYTVSTETVTVTATAQTTTTTPTTTTDPAPSGTVYFRGDYETGDFSQWGGVQREATDRALVQTSPTRQGRYAAKFTVESGDSVHASWPGERSTVLTDVQHTHGSEGQDAWYAWSSMIQPGSVLSNQWNDLTSWHHTGNTCPAPLHFDLSSGGHLFLGERGGNLASNCGPQYQRDFDLGQFTFGQWYDLVVHVKWSADPSVGYVEVWLNGRLVLPLTHMATLYVGQSVYWKQGWYRGDTQGTTVVYNDGNVVASDYQDAVTAFPAGSWPATPPN